MLRVRLRVAEASLWRRCVGSAVFVWGDGAEGRLGIGAVAKEGRVFPQEHALAPVRLELPEQIRKLSLGQAHSAAVSESGALYTWGRGKHGETGHGDTKTRNKPRRVAALEGVRIVDVACGAYHTVAVDDEGATYSWGIGGAWFSGLSGVLGHNDKAERLAPTRIESLAEDGVYVKAVAVGYKHSAFLTREADVYCCGVGEYGRQGNGASYDQLVPAPVEFLDPEVEVTKLRAGGAFSLVETAAGELLAWGKNDQGQLGQGASMSMDIYSMENVPVPVGNAVEGKRMRDVATGHGHAVAVDEAGRVWLWGMKLHLEAFHFPAFDGKSIQRVAAGMNYTAAVGADGKLYTMGHGNSWTLGHGDKKTLRQPQEVLALSGMRCLDVACGERHMAVIVADGAGDAEGTNSKIRDEGGQAS